MLNQTLIQKEYEFLADVIYLDTSLVSMPPLRVQKAWKEYIEGYVSTYCRNYGTYFPNKLERARKEMAKLLQVEPEEIAFTHSTSDSMTLLANSFPFREGDNVIITSQEHASNAVPWLGLKRLGVEVKIVAGRDGFVEDEDMLAAADERTRIISVASVFFCSGYAIDLKKIGAECQKKGIILAVDGTQSMGRLKMAPKELGIDFVAGGGHKGLLGTKSVGYAYCSSELAKQLRPYTGSLQGAVNAGRPFALHDYEEIEWCNGAGRLESGNYPYALIEAVGNGVSLINELGIDNIEASVRGMEAQLREKIAGLPLKVLTPPIENRSGMLFIYYPEKADPEQVRKILWEHRVRATVRYDYIRMTLDFYNTPEQMDEVAKTLQEIAALGQADMENNYL